MIALSCIVLLVLSIRLSQAVDWRDVIPQPSDFALPTDLSLIITSISGVNDTSWNQIPGITPVYYTDGGDYTETAIVLSPSNKTIFVVFRGLDPSQISDLIAGAILIRGPFGPVKGSPLLPGTVGQGFNLKLFHSSLYVPLTDMLKKVINQNPGYKLVVTGKSAGAAYATLYGAYLASTALSKSFNIQVLELASPRLCNDVFKSAVRNLTNLAIWHIVYERDLVPRSPPKSLGFRHVGHLIYWNGYNNVKAYYQTESTSSIVYKSVDFGPGVLSDNNSSKYKNAVGLSISDPAHYWPVAFETIPNPVPNPPPTAAPVSRPCCFYFIFCWRYCKN